MLVSRVAVPFHRCRAAAAARSPRRMDFVEPAIAVAASGPSTTAASSTATSVPVVLIQQPDPASGGASGSPVSVASAATTAASPAPLRGSSFLRFSSASISERKGRPAHFSLPFGVLFSPVTHYDRASEAASDDAAVPHAATTTALAAPPPSPSSATEHARQQLLRRAPIRCATCGAYVSCYSPIDFAAATWQCVMCGAVVRHEHFALFAPSTSSPREPPVYTPESLLEMRRHYPELVHEVADYLDPAAQPLYAASVKAGPAFIFVIDCNVTRAEMEVPWRSIVTTLPTLQQLHRSIERHTQPMGLSLICVPM